VQGEVHGGAADRGKRGGGSGERARQRVRVRERGVPAGQKFTAPTTPVVLNQDGCRYHPHVFGMMASQPLEIRNSDPLLHNIKALAKKNRPSMSASRTPA